MAGEAAVPQYGRCLTDSQVQQLCRKLEQHLKPPSQVRLVSSFVDLADIVDQQAIYQVWVTPLSSSYSCGSPEDGSTYLFDI